MNLSQTSSRFGALVGAVATSAVLLSQLRRHMLPLVAIRLSSLSLPPLRRQLFAA